MNDEIQNLVLMCLQIALCLVVLFGMFVFVHAYLIPTATHSVNNVMGMF